MSPRMLSFQRLDVYQRAIEFLTLVYEIVDDLPRGHADRADQLMRAAESVVRNIASLDVMRLRKILAQERYDRGVQLLEGVVSMLTKMV